MPRAEPHDWMLELVGAIGLTSLYDSFKRACFQQGVPVMEPRAWCRINLIVQISPPMFIRAIQAGVEFGAAPSNLVIAPEPPLRRIIQ
jgi:hypothetical protein